MRVKEPPNRIKVVDRRRFTNEGVLREDGLAAEQPEVAVTPPEASPPSRSAPSAPKAEPKAANSVVFLELVAMLVQQAELMLTGAEGLPPQPQDAQRLIDYLGVLEEKTRGNLAAEEEKVLSDVIFQLRSMYIQRGR